MTKQQLSFYGACVFAANIAQIKGLLCFIVAAILWSVK